MKKRLLVKIVRLALIIGTLPIATICPNNRAGASASASAWLAPAAASGIVRSIANAPIVPDGNVAGAPTDLVIDLDTSLDPNVAGRTLLKGKTIQVILPHEFENNGALPVEDFFGSPSCVPSNLRCNSAVLLQGWPQHPILPAVPPLPTGQGAPRYSLSLNGTNTIVFTADEDLIPGVALAGPGIKQIHLILYGFRNPQPGFYEIQVIAETGTGGAVETGSAQVHVLPRIRPSINVTSVFNGPSNPNTIYQETAPRALTPFPFDLLLWDRDGEPLSGVTVVMVSPSHGLLRQGERVVGRVVIDAPSGADGQEVFTQVPSFPISAPVSGVPAARLTAFFRAGSATGEYVVIFTLNGGNAVRLFVQVS